MTVHGLRDIDEVDPDLDWECYCGLSCVNSIDPELVWIAHVKGLSLSAPEIDRGEVQYIELDCGCVKKVPWPNFSRVAWISGVVILCVNHPVGYCFHADVGVDGLPYYQRSSCPVVEKN